MFDFVTNLWPGAERLPASLPQDPPTDQRIDDQWKLVGTSPAKPRKQSRKSPAKAKQAWRPFDGVDAVIVALIKTAREIGPWKLMSVTELAEAMGVSVGEASKRVKEAAEVQGFVWAQRSGRQKMVGLHRVTRYQWDEIAASSPAEAVGAYRRHVLQRFREADPPVVHRST